MTRIKFLNLMGQRIAEVSGRSHPPQGRVRLPHEALPSRALRTGGNNLTTKCYRHSPTSAGNLSCHMRATSRKFFAPHRSASGARTDQGRLCSRPHRYRSSQPRQLPPAVSSTQHFPRNLLLGCRRPAICCQTSASGRIADGLSRPRWVSRVNFSPGAAFA